jgi:carboxymethylenebutenolidase
VLAIYGGADAGIPAEARKEFDRALDAAGVEHRSVTYDGAPHSFFDRKAADFADASDAAWDEILAFMRIR